MKNSYDRVFNARLIIGVAIIIVGVLSLLANLGFDVDIHLWDYWPVILILIGLSMLLKKPEYRNSLGGWIFLILGILFLLNNFEIIYLSGRIIWPLIIIAIGILILRHGFGHTGRTITDSDHVNITAVLGGGDYNYSSKNLSGGKVFTFMGGAKLNFRDADMVGDSMIIDIFALMGGVDILVPESWQVTMHGVPILGGMDNKATRPQTSGAGTAPKNLIIKGTAIMGGIEVKN